LKFDAPGGPTQLKLKEFASQSGTTLDLTWLYSRSAASEEKIKEWQKDVVAAVGNIMM
jgi:hypothetical protein